MESLSVLRLYCATALLKALLVRAPYSTDLLVHMHWKDLTTRYPVRLWYTAATGPPYLDYPPLFAYLEWLLGQLAHWLAIPLEPKAGHVLVITLAFMRFTVIVLDAVLFLGMRPWSSLAERRLVSSSPATRASEQMLWVVSHPALWFIDHVHFQYNGLVLGAVLYSLGALFAETLAEQRRMPLSRWRRWRACAAFLLALGLKHTTALSIAPIVMLCLWQQQIWKDGAVVAFGLCWLLLMLGVPFGGIDWRALYARLFPLKERGLLHAYWAPNAYALLAAVDKIAVRLWSLIQARLVWLTSPSFGVSSGRASQPRSRISNSAGLVETAGGGFALFPEWTPQLAAICTLVAMGPSLIALMRLFREQRDHAGPGATRSTSRQQTQSLRRGYECLSPASAQTALSMFLFGWHVHEKALILPTFLTGLALGPRHPVAALLSTACSLAMFPLVSAPAMRLVRLALILWHWLYFAPLPIWPQSRSWLMVYCYDAIGLLLSEVVTFWRGWQRLGYPFMPLLLQSTYSALAVVFTWGYLSAQLWRQMVAEPRIVPSKSIVTTGHSTALVWSESGAS
ncbi:glycosyl transferase [Cyanidiococcus yangmingshanensis]|uniref:Alpha-1,3-glucosyltransferase n=1 Tax=Cyanidiococcus yangmingshanensis TaxID=2690220 RepID=A0A7J7IL87_9RHOD|nr:glycosyl transferase [Cyanidiococcus yangmingshanensis]